MFIGVQMNDWTQRFPGQYCTVTRWSMLLTSLVRCFLIFWVIGVSKQLNVCIGSCFLHNE